MRFQGLDLNLLVALDALLTEQNVSKAAKTVHLSQSAMSGALNRLREFFHDDLLAPTGRRMVLTPRAEQLAEPVRAALLQIRTTITTRPEFDPAASTRSFSIVASDYAAIVALAAGLRAISLAAPGMSFRLVPVDASAVERIERAEADFLVTLEQHVAADHPSVPLFEDEYVVVAWSGNRLIDTELDEDTYFSLGHVGVELGASRATVLDAWSLQSGARSRRVEVTAASFTVVPHLLIGTDRIATMHRRMAALFARSMPLRIFPAPVDLPRLRQRLQHHRLAEADPATLWVRDQLVQAVSTQSEDGA